MAGEAFGPVYKGAILFWGDTERDPHLENCPHELLGVARIGRSLVSTTFLDYDSAVLRADMILI